MQLLSWVIPFAIVLSVSQFPSVQLREKPQGTSCFAHFACISNPNKFYETHCPAGTHRLNIIMYIKDSPFATKPSVAGRGKPKDTYCQKRDYVTRQTETKRSANHLIDFNYGWSTKMQSKTKWTSKWLHHTWGFSLPKEYKSSRTPSKSTCMQ